MAAEETDARVAELRRELAKRDRAIARREQTIDQRDRRIRNLELEIDRLRQLIEELQRSSKRQASPFSKGDPKKNPKRRGRKSGKRYGQRAFRAAPARADRVIDVSAPVYCPECSAPTKLDHTERQWQTDIPPIQAVTTEFRTDVARCTKCGRQVRARHPEQTSNATGAAAVQIGPRLISLTATLNKECGVSYGRIATLFERVFGAEVAASTLNRSLLRLAKIVKPLHETIGERIRGSPMLSPDETGWRIGGHKAWLHVVATREDSYYLIARSRGTREATALIGANYGGTIVRDGHPSYRVFSEAKSQTCPAHLLRRTDELLEIHSAPNMRKWLFALKSVLQRSIAVRERRDNAEVGPRGLVVSIGQVEAAMDRVLDQAPANDDAQCFVRHLRRERQALFTFLHYDAIPATNFLAEQALRPAVVNRKMSGGNNTPCGAEAQAILMTVLHSAKKRSLDGLTILVNALRSPGTVTHLM